MITTVNLTFYDLKLKDVVSIIDPDCLKLLIISGRLEFGLVEVGNQGVRV